VAEIDAHTKEYMSDRERFADVFNYYIYHGRQVIDPDKLHEMDTTEIALPYGTTGKSKAIQKYRDVFKYLTAMQDEKAAYLLLGIENQSKVHYAMPVRNMLYDAAQYAHQVEQKANEHRKSKMQETVTSDEYLSGFYREDRLLPVITLVIYWSPSAWNGPMSVHEMLSEQDEDLLALVPDYKINLIEPNRMSESDFAKFQTTLAEAFEYIKYSKDKATLQQILQNNQKFHSLDRRTANLINVVTGSQLSFTQEKEVVDMCLAIEQMRQEAIQEATPKIDKAAEVRTLLASIRNLMQTVNFTQEQAMDALKIPESERAVYAQQLNN
jgi:hypothetical protein